MTALGATKEDTSSSQPALRKEAPEQLKEVRRKKEIQRSKGQNGDILKFVIQRKVKDKGPDEPKPSQG